MEHGRIIIVGAGIGGLTVAVALQRAGFHVAVYERAAALKPVGAGLTIQPNAVLALRRMGLGEEVERRGAPLRAGALLRSDGRPLTHSEFGPELIARAGAGIVGIHRATLHEILLTALGNDALQLGRACTGYEQDKEGVRARFSDGSTQTGDVLIGADGIHSAVRAQLLNDGEPVYAGYTSWRGVTADRCGLPDDFGGEMWGRGQRFGGCCIDGGRFYWFAVADAPAGEREPDARTTKTRLLERFGGWGKRVPELLQSTPEDAIFRTDISDRRPSERWGEGRVTLLGDAAHAMTPNLGQGACQAIEDALVLSTELRRASAPDVLLARGPARFDAGLRAYESARRERANSVVVAARRLGAIAQWQNPLACAARDALFRLTPASVMKKQLLEAWRLPY
jgi:2-polyprenyl-6-methoxyphenol hydroxylase-like FAD-dependent oxidoreductase